MLKINTFYTVLLLVLAVALLAASIWVIYSVDPGKGLMSILMFYASTGMFVMFASAFLLYFFRQRFGVREQVQQHLYDSLRQGFWIALFYAAALILQSKGLFSWLNAGLLLVALGFLEGYFIYNNQKSKQINE